MSEGDCPVRFDGSHCECWWEGLDPCCSCGAGEYEPARQMMGGVYSMKRGEKFGVFEWLMLIMLIIGFVLMLAR